jgi:creatinine amidohydrolase
LKFLLGEMSWVQAKEYFKKSDIVILPVGSTEQHGPANPLGTDFLIAGRLGEEVAKRVGVVCLPVIPFGVSSHHRQFWGTVFVSPETLRMYVKGVCLALKYHGVGKVLVVNGHGGNLAALAEMSREMREEGVFVSVFQWWPAAIKLLPDLFEPEERRHAGAEETSVNLALHSHLVELDKAVDEEPRKHAVQVEGLTIPLDTIDETSSGVFGTQSTASTEKGKKVFEAVVEELVRHVEELKKVRIEDLLPKKKA